jgi:NADPH2:quinone reductase
VFSDGPVAGKTILVHGVLGSVSSLAAQLAYWGRATVIGTVVHSGDLDKVDASVVSHPIALDNANPAAAIREYASEGVDRIVDVGPI